MEAAASIGAGIAASSLLLLAFGADSIIELISGCVLYARLRHEYRGDHVSEAALEALERRTGRIAGYLLYALSVYVVVQAIWGLTHRHEAETSLLGMAIAVVAAVGMPILAKAKIRAADRIGSPALRADAMETFTCGYLSWVLLGGLAANALLHWWWLDSVVSLFVVPLLLREAREAITGQCSCH
ncbi:MAG TPA: cation transporter [Rhodocyclaceae bacterium]